MTTPATGRDRDSFTHADGVWLKGLQARLQEEAQALAGDTRERALITSAVRISEAESVRRALHAVKQLVQLRTAVGDCIQQSPVNTEWHGLDETLAEIEGGHAD